MKTHTLIRRAAVLGLTGCAAAAFVSTPTAQAQPGPGGLFAPPNTGAPKTRVGGGVRGGLMLPNTGAPKTRIGGGVRGGAGFVIGVGGEALASGDFRAAGLAGTAHRGGGDASVPSGSSHGRIEVLSLAAKEPKPIDMSVWMVFRPAAAPAAGWGEG